MTFPDSEVPPRIPSPGGDGDLLCVHVGPSQPSLQMQVKTSPPPTHVPPFSQGPESHELFWATRCKSLCLAFFLRRSFESEPRRKTSDPPVLQVPPPQPDGQLHRKESPWSKQVPPLLQVVASHWLSPESRG